MESLESTASRGARPRANAPINESRLQSQECSPNLASNPDVISDSLQLQTSQTFAADLNEPIATLVFQDGQRVPIYKPLAGHEDLFEMPPQAQTADGPGTLASRLTGPQYCLHASVGLSKPATSAPELQKGIPRTLQQSPTHLGARCKRKSPSEDLSVSALESETDTDNEGSGHTGFHDGTVAGDSRTFYVGDFAVLEDFFRRRFGEVTVKCLHALTTCWIAFLEPKRRTRWGPYHDMLPTEKESPPW